MTPAARIAAAAEILDQIIDGEAAEKALTGWARRSRFAGSKDRAALRDLVFDALRCRRSFAALGGAETGRGLMIGALLAQGDDPAHVFTGEGHAPSVFSDEEVAWIGASPALSNLEDAVAADMPDWLWPQVSNALGDKTQTVCATLRTRAPVFLRVNLRQTSRDKAIQALADESIETRPHPDVPTALEVTQGARRIAQSQSYLNGLVELQDAASQAVVCELPLKDGLSVLDYCAGGGGKALAMASLADCTYVAHDAFPARMKDLPARADRAGVRIRVAATPKGPFDLVLCDAPCSGSGSWRRAPEGKWLLTPDRLDQLNATQDQILETAAPLVSPGGTLAYATCSFLAAENTDRVRAFLERHPDWSMQSDRQWLPGAGGDGFYLVLLTRGGG